MDRLFIIIFFFAFANLHSQSAISGEIKDSNGLPIEGVNIYLVGTIDGSTSNSNGIFSFETSEKGDVTLIASFIGYKDFSITSDINELINIKIVLQEDDSNLDEVIISASTF